MEERSNAAIVEKAMRHTNPLAVRANEAWEKLLTSSHDHLKKCAKQFDWVADFQRHPRRWQLHFSAECALQFKWLAYWVAWDQGHHVDRCIRL
jgi:hypothetical protein